MSREELSAMKSLSSAPLDWLYASEAVATAVFGISVCLVALAFLSFCLFLRHCLGCRCHCHGSQTIDASALGHVQQPLLRGHAQRNSRVDAVFKGNILSERFPFALHIPFLAFGKKCPTLDISSVGIKFLCFSAQWHGLFRMLQSL